MDEIERPKTFVQWTLSNRCNYNCSYCLDIFKKGTVSFPDNDCFVEVCKDIICHYDELGRDVVFEFTGGEPFLIEQHFDLLRYAVKNNYAKNIEIHYNTNGTLYPEYAEPTIFGDQRLGSSSTQLQVFFSTSDGELGYNPNTVSEFQQFELGSRWTLKLNAIGSVLSVER